jgi:hypothetical protein
MMARPVIGRSAAVGRSATIDRSASLIVCDDMLYGLTGKAFLQGIYTADITIPGDALHMAQLVFYFSVVTPKNKPFKNVKLKVALVGEEQPRQVEVPIAAIMPTLNPDRPKMILRAPFLIQNMVIRPGKIETHVITESEELDAGGIWVLGIPPVGSS